MAKPSVLWRQRHLFSLRLLFASMVLSVAAVVAITSISSILSNGLTGASSTFLAGDRQLTSPRLVSDEWLLKARSLGLRVAQSAEFTTMVSHRTPAGEPSFQLVAVKAVGDAYPLKGEVLIADHDGQNVQVVRSGPDSGTLWMQSRLYELLGVNGGGEVSVGAYQFLLGGVLNQEPDVGFQLGSFAPRLMISLNDLAKTEVVQPGSRVKWQVYFSGPPIALSQYESWIKPRLNASQKWIGLKEGRPAISDALEKAERYLLLGGSLSILLAALAIAISARQFAVEQGQFVAIVKALGVSGSALLRKYLFELGVLAGFSVVFGWVLSAAAVKLWVYLMADSLPAVSGIVSTLPPLRSIMLAIVTVIIFLVAFAYPQLSSLRAVAPMRVLRAGEDSAGGWQARSLSMAAAGVIVLLFWYGRDWLTVSILLFSLLSILAIVGLLHTVILKLLARAVVPALRLGSPLRLTLQGLLRRKKDSVLQLSVFTIAIFLFAVLLLARTGLINDWQTQLPDRAPNHFLVNIPPHSISPLESLFSEHNIESTALYPMVRGRLSHINGEDVKVAVTKDVGALNRELNLSWTPELPADNELLEGAWWDANESNDGRGVSIESELAEKLDVRLGDKLRFTIGGQTIEAGVQSIRRVEWDSMRPNFYMLFAEGALNDFPSTYITSFYLPKGQKGKLNHITQRFPTVSLLELDELVTKIKSIVSQVSNVIELLLVFVFLAALLVLMALVAVSRKARVQESVLLRTMGASGGLLHRIQLYEFAVLGLVSSMVALAAAEVVVYILRQKFFGGAFDPYWQVWVSLPLVSALTLSLFGYAQTRKIPLVSPVLILRSKADGD